MLHRRGASCLQPSEGEVGSVSLGARRERTSLRQVLFEEHFQVKGAASAWSWMRPQAQVEEVGCDRREEGVREASWVPLGITGLPAAAL